MEEINVGTDSHALVEAIQKSYRWPRYRSLLHQIAAICLDFAVIDFEVESVKSNKVAREISKSVLRDGRHRSYLAMGGPSWFHKIIRTEGVIVNS